MSSPRRRRESGPAGLLYPLLGACLWAAVVGYKPVIIVHGLFDSSGDFKILERFINEVSDRNEETPFHCGYCVDIMYRARHLHVVLQGLTLYSMCCGPCSLYKHVIR